MLEKWHLRQQKPSLKLQARFFAIYFVEGDLTLLSRYLSHFQPTLRCLHFNTSLENPKNLVKFIAFFSRLVEISIETLFLSLPSLPDNKTEGFGPDLLSPLGGSL